MAGQKTIKCDSCGKIIGLRTDSFFKVLAQVVFTENSKDRLNYYFCSKECLHIFIFEICGTNHKHIELNYRDE